jgi:hypothetical protein
VTSVSTSFSFKLAEPRRRGLRHNSWEDEETIFEVALLNAEAMLVTSRPDLFLGQEEKFKN